MGFDRDRSGTVEPHELQQALTAFGYNLSPQVMGVLIRRYSTDGRVAFDAFVALCVKLRSLTSESQQMGWNWRNSNVLILALALARGPTQMGWLNVLI